MYKLICFIELKWDFSDMKLYSPCIQLNNYSEDKVLYIGYRLLYFKKGMTIEDLLIVTYLNYIIYKINYKITG